MTLLTHINQMHRRGDNRRRIGTYAVVAVVPGRRAALLAQRPSEDFVAASSILHGADDPSAPALLVISGG